MPDVRPRGDAEGSDSQLAVLVGGALVLFFGVPAVATVASLGAYASGGTGVGLVALAWFLPTTHDSRIIRVLVGLLGAVALMAAGVSLLG